MTEQSAKNDSTQALADLVKSGRWQRVPIATESALVFARVWEIDGSSDILTVKSVTSAIAERINGYGNPVYRNTGTVLDMIEAVTELPEPGTPGAPVNVLGLPESDDVIMVEVPDNDTT